MAHDPDDISLAELGSAARASWRADEDEWTAAAYEQWCHGRTLVDRARDHLHRGDTLVVELRSSQPVTGIVIGVAPDVLALRAAGGRVDVRFGRDACLAWHVARHARHGGSTGIVLDGFRARLLELESSGRSVELGASVGTSAWRGRIAVGRDHVAVLDDDGATAGVIGLHALEWVRLPDDGTR